jgi:DNA-binding transcriptional ArsR family regulator
MAASEPLPSEPGLSTGHVRRRATEAEARALASALRLRILRLCYGEELTNKEIAQRLHRDPASVLHHVRRLVDTGFLDALPARRGTRGAREIPYRATGKSWTLDVRDAGPAGRGKDAMLQAFLDELADAGGELVEASRLTLQLQPDDRNEFIQRIQAVLDEFANRPADPHGQWWSVFFAVHPDQRGKPR